jgi:hypothetical protein
VSHLYTITSHAHRREKVETSAATAGNNLAHTNDTSNGESQLRAPQQGAFSSLATLGMTDGPEQVDEEDFGGLMVCITFTRSYWGGNGPHFHL